MHTLRRADEGPQASAFAAKPRSFIFSPDATGIPLRLMGSPTLGGEAHHG